MAAVPGNEYAFDKLDFEVREVLPEGEGSSWFSFSGIFGFLSVLSLLGAIGAAGYFVYLMTKGKQAGGASASQGGVEKAYGGDVQMANINDKARHQAFTDE